MPIPFNTFRRFSTFPSAFKGLAAEAPLLYLVRLLVSFLELLVMLLADVGGLALNVEAGCLRLRDTYRAHGVLAAVADGALLALIDLAQCYQEISVLSPL